ncbi:MAG: hypothetical protein CL676_11325 [Bdellovibrionaceae bacterium]|nr:hypothetical protein [Pseudobdellovibrionaceae bacterium]|tara:strand:+ start:1229 stop:1408 length:180 start_codon:yes stop_codon:yes gene_type:complete
MLKEDNEIIKQDNLMKAIGKSEVLIEQHEEALEEAEEKTEDIEGWLTVFLKAIKNVILN